MIDCVYRAAAIAGMRVPQRRGRRDKNETSVEVSSDCYIIL
jgi:hypothetical protein